MPNETGSPLLSFIRSLTVSRGHSELPDGELVKRFAVLREEPAFVTLMHRHGPMVLGVCQSILREDQDAEDAFQATFLVLVRKARAIGKPASVASWLHGVALRLAMRVRAQAARRHAGERRAVPMPSGKADEEVVWRDLRPVLHEEVARLPERYRLPFVLCYLEGKTNEEVADFLGLPKGTVLSRLSRARARLRERLTRRGLALTSGLFAGLLAQNAASGAVPIALAEGTLRAALAFTSGSTAMGSIAASVLAHANGMLRAALMAKLRLTAGITLAATLAATGAGVLVYQARTPGGAGSAPGGGPPGAVTREPPRSNDLSPAQRGEDEKRIQGTWVVATAEQRGRIIDVLKDRRLVFTGDQFRLAAGDKEVRGIIPGGALKGSFTLESGSPNRIDLIDKAWRLRGIYALEGDSLRICLVEVNAKERPVEFATNPASSQLLLGLQRE
jgi:RNA polymerase sigma factor (sigma-70 family)